MNPIGPTSPHRHQTAHPQYVDDGTVIVPPPFGRPATAPPPVPARRPARGFLAGILAAGLIGGIAGSVTTTAIDGGGSPTVHASAATPAAAASGSTTIGTVAAKAMPSVVEIGVQTPTQKGLGSGIVYDQNGDIVTNAHVVDFGASASIKITVKLSDGRTSSASIVGVDQSADIAVLRITSPAAPSPSTFADSSKVKVGDEVVAIGAPEGLAQTVTSGIVSYVGREVTAGGDHPGQPKTSYQAIQTDAAINPGNSGGPLLDAHGDVIGINSVIYSPTAASGAAGNVGLGFAIPINQVRTIADSLIGGTHRG